MALTFKATFNFQLSEHLKENLICHCFSLNIQAQGKNIKHDTFHTEVG